MSNTQSIIQILSQMESDLKDIQSAKRQVENAVKTSEELQSVFSKYVTSLESLLTNVKNWTNEISSFQSSNIKGIEESIKKISTSCDEVMKTFSTSTNDLTSNLKEKVEEELGKFEGANSKLISQVEKLLRLNEHLKTTTTAVNAIKKQLDDMLKELKDSQKSQDKSLDELKRIQDGISTRTDDVLDSCKSILQAQDGVLDNLRENKNLISSLKENVLEDIKKCSDKINNLEKSVLDIKRDNETNTKQIKSEISILDQKVESLKTQLTATIQNVKKEVNINRLILIVGIVILAVLLFVCKFVCK